MKKNTVIRVVSASLFLLLFIAVLVRVLSDVPKNGKIIPGKSIDLFRLGWTAEKLIECYPNPDYVYFSDAGEYCKKGIEIKTVKAIVEKMPAVVKNTGLISDDKIYNGLFVYSDAGVVVNVLRGRVAFVTALNAGGYKYNKINYVIKKGYPGSYLEKVAIGMKKSEVEEVLGPVKYPDDRFNYKYEEMSVVYDESEMVKTIQIMRASESR